MMIGGMAFDVTDRIQAEEALRISEDKFRTIFDKSPFLIAITDMQTGRLVDVNETLCRETGMQRDELIGKTTTGLGFYSKNDRELFLKNLLEYGFVQGLEMDFKSKLGHHVAKMHANIISLNGKDRILTTFEDIALQKEAEKALQESEQRFRSIFQNKHTPMLIIDPKDGAILDANQAAVEFYGWSHKELTGMNIRQINTLAAEEIAEEMQAARQLERKFFRFKHRVKDGTIRDVEVTSGPVEIGENSLLYSIIQDVTDRNRAQKALEESEQRLKMAMLGGGYGMWDWDIITGEVVYSDFWAEMFGFPPEEVEPTVDFFLQCVHPDDREAVNHHLQDHLNGQQPIYQSEHRMVTKSGETIWTMDRGTVVQWDDQGNPVRAIGLITSINELKQAQEKVQKSEEQLRQVLESLPEEVFVHDMDGRFLLVNKAACRNTGYDYSELTSMRVADIDPESVPRRDHRDIWERLSHGGQAALEAKHKRKDGGEYPVELTFSAITLGNEPVVLAIGRDITERKRAEEERTKLQMQLAHAQRMEALGTLAGGIAHDFNNILAAIMGFSELALDRAEVGEPSPEELKHILSSAERAKDLVIQILTFSRKVKSELKPIDLNDVVCQIERMLARTLPRMVEIETQLTEDLWLINADHSQVTQMLMNLCTNASDAMPDGGKLTIRTENETLDEGFHDQQDEVLPGDYVRLIVSDTGHGINLRLGFVGENQAKKGCFQRPV